MQLIEALGVLPSRCLFKELWFPIGNFYLRIAPRCRSAYFCNSTMRCLIFGLELLRVAAANPADHCCSNYCSCCAWLLLFFLHPLAFLILRRLSCRAVAL